MQRWHRVTQARNGKSFHYQSRRLVHRERTPRKPRSKKVHGPERGTHAVKDYAQGAGHQKSAHRRQNRFHVAKELSGQHHRDGEWKSHVYKYPGIAKPMPRGIGPPHKECKLHSQTGIEAVQIKIQNSGSKFAGPVVKDSGKTVSAYGENCEQKRERQPLSFNACRPDSAERERRNSCKTYKREQSVPGEIVMKGLYLDYTEQSSCS